ncbi:MAG TPA: glycosyltransferase [Blastocatellia bacterium]|nr:glycosyltransferase [Blastocatellia bacterium]
MNITAVDPSKKTSESYSCPTPQKNKVFIAHIINGLYTGGAEMMLYKLLSQMNRDQFEACVITLIGGDSLKDRVENLGIKVYTLGMTRSNPSLAATIRLAKILRQRPPALVQTWMYHSDLMGGVVAKLLTKAPIVWNLQASDIIHHPDNKTTWMTIKLCSFLSSGIPARIISCSEVACRLHAGLGYDKNKLLPIPNGVELLGFRPDPAARIALRQELGLAPEVRLVGLVARFHPQKDHHNFVQAAAHLHQIMPDIHFVLCGEDVTPNNQQLVEWISAAGLSNHCHLLGRREDTPRINAAIDVATLSSAFGEGFPNVLGEAMACETPCVVTDVGDSGLIVGDTGVVVPPRDPAALAKGWQKILQMNTEEKKALGLAARRHVEEKFGLPSVVARYEALYRDLLGLSSHLQQRD